MSRAGIALGWDGFRCSPSNLSVLCWSPESGRCGDSRRLCSVYGRVSEPHGGREACGPWGLPSGNCKRDNPHFWRGDGREQTADWSGGPSIPVPPRQTPLWPLSQCLSVPKVKSSGCPVPRGARGEAVLQRESSWPLLSFSSWSLDPGGQGGSAYGSSSQDLARLSTWASIDR